MEQICCRCKFCEGRTIYNGPYRCSVAGKNLPKGESHPACTHDGTCPNWQSRLVGEERVSELEKEIDEVKLRQEKITAVINKNLRDLEEAVRLLKKKKRWFQWQV